MKNGWIAVLVLSVMLAACGKKEEPSEAKRMALADTLPRASITFILGIDENAHNPYYSLADQYYRLNDSDKTEIVIDTIYSLSGVLRYLAQNPPRNGRPWGLINLVSHGNEFIDLSASVTPGGPRISEESVRQAMHDSLLAPLDSSIADYRTLINLHGCAVGKNLGLLRMLGVAFGGAHQIRVKASRMFEYYNNISQTSDPRFIRHYFARVWYAFYRPDTIPTDSQLANNFRSRYPAADVDWLDAVRRSRPNDPSEAYNIRMVIPVVWEDFYKTKQEMPDVRAKSRQDDWIQAKPEFQALMARTYIPRENFLVKFYNATYAVDSQNVFGLRVKARAGVACVIKPVLAAASAARNLESFTPYIPPSDDTEYFGFALPADPSRAARQGLP